LLEGLLQPKTWRLPIGVLNLSRFDSGNGRADAPDRGANLLKILSATLVESLRQKHIASLQLPHFPRACCVSSTPNSEERKTKLERLLARCELRLNESQGLLPGAVPLHGKQPKVGLREQSAIACPPMPSTNAKAANIAIRFMAFSFRDAGLKLACG
jgi:hypothetical protein